MGVKNLNVMILYANTINVNITSPRRKRIMEKFYVFRRSE
jgi:hypothetical protein